MGLFQLSLSSIFVSARRQFRASSSAQFRGLAGRFVTPLLFRFKKWGGANLSLMPPLPDTEAVLRLWPWHGGMGWEKFPSDDLSALPRTVYAAFAAAGAQRRSRKKLHTMYLLLFSSSPGIKVHTHSVSQPAKAAPQTFSRPPPSKILRTHDYTIQLSKKYFRILS